MEGCRWPLLALAMALIALASAGVTAEPLACMQRFKLRDFVIGAWWGPDPSEHGYRMYKDAGFNVLMTYRNRANATYGADYQLPDFELKLARKVGLWVMLDTYMRNDTPWGGVELNPPPEPGAHHPARAAELAWLQERYGRHPRLVGYLLGDNCGLHGYMVDNAKTLLATAPGLFPWVSTNPDVGAQAQAPMPLLSSQNYPFLYQVNESEPTKRLAFCNRLELDRRCANEYDMALWPFINCCDAVSPSQLRFQMLASIAYGAQGIWYFHYHCNVWDPQQEQPGPLYDAAKACNGYVADVVGPRVVGHRCTGVFHTPGPDTADNALTPGPGRLIEQMSDALLAGILAPEKRLKAGRDDPEYVLVVDKRTVRPDEEEPPARAVHITFGPAVQTVTILNAEAVSKAPSRRQLRDRRTLRLRLAAGDGVLLKVN
ncbi:MAG: hypothetical protein JSV65_19865 [Armatimonadota bacterium]|nr:MAG: hypothetical protein JSV65_19865 [Armatimonadota bacterium]